jgi:hypothetical protein
MRRSGRTTRLIDTAIQELFTTGETQPMPHMDVPLNRWYREQKRMVDILMRRLRMEHRVEVKTETTSDGWIKVIATDK